VAYSERGVARPGGKWSAGHHRPRVRPTAVQTREGNLSFVFGLRESPQSKKCSFESYIVVLNVGVCLCFLQTKIRVNITTDINGTMQGSMRNL